MAATGKTNIQTDITASIRSGASDTTATELRALLNEILDSYPNIVDGGLLFQNQVGYSTFQTLTQPKAFVYKYWVEQLVAASSTLDAVLANGNTMLNTQFIQSEDWLKTFQVIDTKIDATFSDGVELRQFTLDSNGAYLSLGGTFSAGITSISTGNTFTHNVLNEFNALNNNVNGNFLVTSPDGFTTHETNNGNNQANYTNAAIIVGFGHSITTAFLSAENGIDASSINAYFGANEMVSTGVNTITAPENNINGDLVAASGATSLYNLGVIVGWDFSNVQSASVYSNDVANYFTHDLRNEFSATLNLFNGLAEYNIDYSASYTIRSFTDKGYVDAADVVLQNQINNINAGLKWKNSVRAATTANITLSGDQTIDGVSVIAGDRVLVKNQSTGSQNGIYLCASGSWTRTTDSDTAAEILQATTSIEEGTVNADTIYTCTTNAPIILGTTSLAFAKTSATTYTASAGVTLTGNDFSLNNSYFSGDATVAAGVITLASTIAASTKGAADKSLAISYDAKGRLTAVTENAISILANQVSNFDASVRATVLTGLSYSSYDEIAAADTTLGAFGKLAGRTRHLWDYNWSAGALSGFAIADNGNGTANIATGVAMLRTSVSSTATLNEYTLAAVTNQAFTDNAVNYIVADYNSGTPMITVTTTQSAINTQTVTLIYAVTRVGNSLYYQDTIAASVDTNGKIRRKFLLTERFQYSAGAIISATNRKIALTAGTFVTGVKPVLTSAFDTNVASTFTYVYYNGTNYTRTTVQTDINNTNYINAGVSTTMTNNRFRTDFVYLLMSQSPQLWVVQGDAQHANLAAAKLATIPANLPPELVGLGLVVGRVIIEKSATTLADVASSFTTSFVAGTATEHNQLGGLQGGTTAEYYHMTNTEYTNFQAGNFTKLGVTGTAGAGFLELSEQSSDPASGASGFRRFFANANGRLTGKASSGQLNTYGAIIYKDFTNSSAVTGTTSAVLTKSVLIKGGTFTTGDSVQVFASNEKTGTAAGLTVRIYYNSSASLGGATVLATQTQVNTVLDCGLLRNFDIQSATVTRAVNTTTSLNTDEAFGSAAASSTGNIDWTQDIYIIIGVQNTSAADSTLTRRFYVARV